MRFLFIYPLPDCLPPAAAAARLAPITFSRTHNSFTHSIDTHTQLFDPQLCPTRLFHPQLCRKQFCQTHNIDTRTRTHTHTLTHTHPRSHTHKRHKDTTCWHITLSHKHVCCTQRCSTNCLFDKVLCHCLPSKQQCSTSCRSPVTSLAGGPG